MRVSDSEGSLLPRPGEARHRWGYITGESNLGRFQQLASRSASASSQTIASVAEKDDALQVDVFAYEYSGYGHSTGTPSEDNMYSDARAALHLLEHGFKLKPERDIVLYGKSIGSCLGDLYSVTWMEDADKMEVGETIGDQTTAVSPRVTSYELQVWSL